MKKIKAATAEEALSTLALMRSHKPYEWSGLRYARRDGDYWYFYCTKPLPNDCKLYKIPKP